MPDLLDSVIWIEILQGHTIPRRRLQIALVEGRELIVSPVVYYEVMRGLRQRRDEKSIHFLETLWSRLTYIAFTEAVWNRAADLWVEAIRSNQKREDADILIAAHALTIGARVVTANTRHFQNLGVELADWTTA